MNKDKLNIQHRIFYFLLASFLISSGSFAEEVKVVTYYPAPYSEYKELNTTQNTNLATNTAVVSGVPTYKVGIGTSAPAQKLDVVGNVKFSGALMPGGSAGTDGQVLTSQGANAAPAWRANSHATVFFRDTAPFKTMMRSQIPANTKWFDYGLDRMPAFTLTQLKERYPQMAAETRNIIGVIFEFQVQFQSIVAANIDKPLMLYMSKEAPLGGDAVPGGYNNSAFPFYSNNIAHQTREFYGQYTSMDMNANGTFDHEYHYKIYRHDANFTVDGHGFASVVLYVVGYMTGD